MQLYLNPATAKKVSDLLIDFSIWKGESQNEESKRWAFFMIADAAFKVRKKKNKREFTFVMTGAYVLPGDKTKPQTLYYLNDFSEECILEKEVRKELNESIRLLHNKSRVNSCSAQKVYAPDTLCEIYLQFVSMWIDRHKAKFETLEYILTNMAGKPYIPESKSPLRGVWEVSYRLHARGIAKEDPKFISETHNSLIFLSNRKTICLVEISYNKNTEYSEVSKVVDILNFWKNYHTNFTVRQIQY